jgi:hypothetical protein
MRQKRTLVAVQKDDLQAARNAVDLGSNPDLILTKDALAPAPNPTSV